MASSDPPALCPPVVLHTRAEQAEVAGELSILPVGSLIADWLVDYVVMRDQARACGGVLTSRSFATENGHILPHFLE